MPENHVIITISRTKGAGGSEIGMCVAARRGFTFLDRELLTKAAERLDESPNQVADRDERHLRTLERSATLYALGMPFALSTPPSFPSIGTKRLFEVQTSLVEEAASSGPTVIVGRAAHWILRGQRLLLSVFLHAPLKARVCRMRTSLGLKADEEAVRVNSEFDTRREVFLRWVTGRSRGKPTDYHLCVDTWRIDLQLTIELIVAAAEGFKQGLHPRERTGL